MFKNIFMIVMVFSFLFAFNNKKNHGLDIPNHNLFEKKISDEASSTERILNDVEDPDEKKEYEELINKREQWILDHPRSWSNTGSDRDFRDYDPNGFLRI